MLQTQTRIPLNSFQQMMLKWADIAPYNAGHFFSISGTPDIGRWEKMTLITLNETGLGFPQFIDNESVQFTPLKTLQINTPHCEMDSLIQIELNRPFLKNDFPMRFFILKADNQSYYFGAIYNHWISDSYSIRALFQRIFHRYQTGDSPLPPLTLHAPPFRSLFRKYVGRFLWFDGIKEFIRCIFHFQSAYRIKLTDVMDFHTGFQRYHLPEGVIQELTQYAKKQRVSVNDVFLTALAKTLGQFTAKNRAHQKKRKLRFFVRNRLALGTIVDIRNPIQDKIKHIFGQYLNNYTLILKNPEQIPAEDLVKQIHFQTHKIKTKFKMIKNFAGWDISLFFWKFLSTVKSQARFFTKNTPVIAGISNVNLTQSWVGEQNPVILDYIRVSPAAILTPLVFTLTTLNKTLSLCVSYRTTGFTKEEVDNLYRLFMGELKELKMCVKSSDNHT